MPTSEHDAYLAMLTGLDVAKARGGGATPVPGAPGPDEDAEGDANGAQASAAEPSATEEPADAPEAEAAPEASSSHAAPKAKRGAAGGHHGKSHGEAAGHGKALAHAEKGEKGEKGGEGEGEEEDEKLGVTLSRTFKIGEWKKHFYKGQIEVAFSITVTAQFSIRGEGLDINQSGDSIGLSAAKELWKSNSSWAFGGVDIFSEPAFAIEAAYSDEAVTLSPKFTVKVPIGEVEVALKAIEKKKGEHLKIGAMAVALTSQPRKFDSFKIGDVEIKNIQASIKGEAEVEPEYIKLILNQAAQKLGIAGGEMAATAAGGEVVIAGSFVAVSVAVVVGGALDLAQSQGISEVGDHRNIWRDKMLKGFRAGYIGLDQPGDPWEAVGYDLGSQNFEKIFKESQAKNPSATPQQIGSAMGARVDKAIEQVRPELDMLAGRAAWESWLKNNQHALAGVARASYTAAFQKTPNDSDPEWKMWKDNQTLGGII